MATGRLGNTVSLTGGSNSTVYTVPTLTYSVFNVSICNTQSSSVTIRVAFTSNPASIGTSEWLEYGVTVAANSVFERTGLVGNAGMAIVVWASSSTTGSLGANVTVNCWGIETSTT
jgi:hypothetical protein